MEQQVVTKETKSGISQQVAKEKEEKQHFCHFCHTNFVQGLRFKVDIEPIGASSLTKYGEEATICNKCAKKIEQRARSLSKVDLNGLTAIGVFRALAAADWLGEFLLRAQRMEERKDEWLEGGG